MSDYIVVTPEFDEEKKRIIKENIQTKNRTINFLASTIPEKRKEVLQRATVLLTFNPERDLSGEEYQRLQNVKFIQLISAGADHFPFKKIPDRIKIASNTGAYGRPIAEHVVAMALCFAKRLREEHQNMQNGDFKQFEVYSKAIYNSTVGILGFGGIGRATARLFKAFGAQIFGMNTTGQTDEPVDFIGTTSDLEHILESSDIVVLSLPLNNNTRQLIRKEQLEWMKSNAILINVARGELINQKDLYEHLKKHPEFKAGLESWWVEPLRHGSFELEYPLLDLPNVLASPHNSSAVPGIMNHGVAEAAKNVDKYLRGEPFKGEINRKDFV